MNEKTTLAEWLAQEPYTLSLTSGFFGFFAHAGFLAACEERDLYPCKLTGSSSGALVAGVSAAGSSAEEMYDVLGSLDRKEFWDPSIGFGLLRGDAFTARLRQILRVHDFADCSTPVALSVFDVKRLRTHVIDSGDLATAIVASCALPGLFHPVRREQQVFLDGGILDRRALAATQDGQRVFHHNIASRSPWRLPGSRAIAPPVRKNLLSLNLHGLPRSGPFRLQNGRKAIELARDLTRRALDKEARSVMHVSLEP